MTPDSQPSPASSQQSADERCAELETELAALRKQVVRLQRFEQEHARQTAFVQQLIELIPMGVAVHTNGVATFINAMGRRIMKAESDEEILGKPAISFVYPDDRERVARRIRELQDSGSGEPFPVAPFIEERLLRLDGEVIDVEVASFPLKTAENEFSLFVLFREITEMKRQRRLLQERNARFRNEADVVQFAMRQGLIT